MVTVGDIEMSGNTSYIYGSSSLLSGTTEKAAMLYYRGGERLFGIEPDIAAGKSTFPSVNLGVDAGLCVGWSKTDSDKYKRPEYVAGDKIPEAGKYYMAVYTADDEGSNRITDASQIQIPFENTAVYFVGDSRTYYMGCSLYNQQRDFFPDKPLLVPDKVNIVAKSGQGLGWLYWEGLTKLKEALAVNKGKNHVFFPDKPLLVPDKVNIVAKSGQGLGWLYWEGLTKLKEALAVNKGKNHVVIMNLGINDAAGVGGYEIYDNADYYVEYMRDSVYKPLKKLYGDKIKFYYMSVNPLCSQAVKDDVGIHYKVTEQNVVNFNRKIYDGLCSGNNKYFTYINAYNNLLLEAGWFSMETNNDKEYDGIHYKDYTSIRIYNYCMAEIKK